MPVGFLTIAHFLKNVLNIYVKRPIFKAWFFFGGGFLGTTEKIDITDTDSYKSKRTSFLTISKENVEEETNQLQHV